MGRIFILWAVLILTLLLRWLFLPPPPSYFPGQAITLVTTLSGQPQTFGKSQKFWLEEDIEVVTGRFPEHHYGEKLKISGILQKGIRWQLIFPQIEKVGEGERSWWLSQILTLRQNLISRYQEFLPEPSSSLLTGIVLGVKSELSAEFKESLRQTGLTHVVVASGMNITLVAGFWSGFLTLFLKRQWTFPFVFLGIFFYALLTGFEAPVVRAAIMGSLALLAQNLGRQSWAALSLILAGWGMLLVEPLLIFDLGFQLSFLATAGLILVKPGLEAVKVINRLGKVPVLGESLTTTLGAQVATLPLILANFGVYPLLSLLANALVLWTIPWMMGLGAAVGIIGLVFKPLGQLLAFGVYSFLFYFEKITLFLANFDFLSLEIENFSVFFSLAYFSFLGALLFGLGKVRKEIE